MLTIDSLTCRRGSRVALRAVTASIAPGACLLVTGANGSGKSTLLRALAGLVPANGEIAWDGAPVAGDWAAQRERLHYIGHQDAVKPELTAAEMIEYWRALQSSSSAPDLTRKWSSSSSLEGSRTEAALAAREGVECVFGVDRFMDRQTRHLSAGQKRRLALTRLLLTPRPLWLLDEPTVALDAAGQGLLLAAITRHRAAGGIAVIATHDALPVPAARGLAL